MTMDLRMGDCLELMATLPDASVDMVMSDLPYGTTACAWDSVLPFDLLWAHYRRVCKPNAAIVLTASQPFTTALIASNMGAFKYCWVWKKPQGVDPFQSKFRPLNNIEDVCVCSALVGCRTTLNSKLAPPITHAATRSLELTKLRGRP